MAANIRVSLFSIFQNESTLSSILSLVLLPHLLPLLTLPAVLLPRSRHRYMPISGNDRFHFSASQPKTLRSGARGYLSELRQFTCPEDSRFSFCFPFSSTEFLVATTNISSSTAADPDKVVYSMLKHFLRSAWIFFLTSSIFPGLYIPFLPFKEHLVLFPFIRWERLCSGQSLLPPASQSFLNASFYLVNFSFWSLTPFSLPAEPAFAQDGLISIRFFIFLSSFRMNLTNPSGFWHNSYHNRLLESFQLCLASRSFS